MKSEIIIGIDLGTTNSEVAVIQNGKVKVIDVDGRKILPSVVGLSPENELLIGEEAKNQYFLYPERTILSIKRLMGKSEKILLGQTAYTPQEISSLILKKLKKAAETALNTPLSKAVITVPAYFSDAQRQATREAGELAGLDVVRIINEPTAAALSYGVDNKEEKIVLVYDLGGGTFDVSLVSLHEQMVEVLASSGNNFLGGDDFDAKIEEFIENNLKKDGVESSISSQARARIKRAAEKAKITLSDHPFALIEEEYLLDHLGNPYHLSLELSREDYKEMIMPFIEETLESVDKVLESAKRMASDVDEILLVGGSTRTPLISEKLETLFRSKPLLKIDPELCVVMGAALQAGAIGGEKCDAVLVDVTPYTFGTNYLDILHNLPYDYAYQPIIEKNTPIPVTKSEVFYTMFDEQEAVEVIVYQGENEDALENIEIGEFSISGLSKVPAGNPIIVNFKLDLDGILYVSAQEKLSGIEQKIVIKNAISQFTEQEMKDAKKKIDSLFQSNEKEGFNDASSAVQNTAHALITKATPLLIQFSQEDQEDIVNLVEEIQEALRMKEDEKLITLTDKLSDMLFYLDANVA